MSAMAAERPRLIIDCTNVVRRAVKLRAAKDDASASEIVMRAIWAYCSMEIREAEKIMDDEKRRKKERGYEQHHLVPALNLKGQDNKQRFSTGRFESGFLSDFGRRYDSKRGESVSRRTQAQAGGN